MILTRPLILSIVENTTHFVPQLNIMEVEDSNEEFEGNEKENEDLDTK
jgi:hypothetical protein